jgi:hypothetical protein
MTRIPANKHHYLPIISRHVNSLPPLVYLPFSTLALLSVTYNRIPVENYVALKRYLRFSECQAERHLPKRRSSKFGISFM